MPQKKKQEEFVFILKGQPSQQPCHIIRNVIYVRTCIKIMHIQSPSAYRKTTCFKQNKAICNFPFLHIDIIIDLYTH